MKTPITVAIAGLGSRGRDTYSRFAEKFPEEMKIVAVADIIPERVAEAAVTFSIPSERCFDSAEAMLAAGKLADVMLICTPDRCHSGHAIPALDLGYHLLLEKPIAPTPEECEAVLEAAKRNNRHVVVCHVLRYTAFYREIKRLIGTGILGEIVTLDSIENVGYYHQAHSFVRGNWRNTALSSPMILQKCCHDMDILLWLADKRLQSINSYGGLYLFREEKAPEGAAMRCMDGCQCREGCPYDCEAYYMSVFRRGRWGWPLNVVTDTPTEEALLEALRTGPYGRCVYHCDNDVVDHQVVNMELEDGVTISHTMSAFTSVQYRHLKVMGTLGDLEADMEKNEIRVTPFGKPTQVIDVRTLSEDFSGHGGGDNTLLAELFELVRNGNAPGSALTSIDISMDSHFACFAAESSRANGGNSVKLR